MLRGHGDANVESAGRDFMCRITGQSLMASGRVPKTKRAFTMRSYGDVAVTARV